MASLLIRLVPAWSGFLFSSSVSPVYRPPGCWCLLSSLPLSPPAGGLLAAGPRAMTAPIPGVVASVAAEAGQTIERGDELLTLDAMKMLNVIRSPWAGTIATVHVEKGDRVVQGEPLVTFVPT